MSNITIKLSPQCCAVSTPFRVSGFVDLFEKYDLKIKAPPLRFSMKIFNLTMHDFFWRKVIFIGEVSKKL